VLIGFRMRIQDHFSISVNLDVGHGQRAGLCPLGHSSLYLLFVNINDWLALGPTYIFICICLGLRPLYMPGTANAGLKNDEPNSGVNFYFKKTTTWYTMLSARCLRLWYLASECIACTARYCYTSSLCPMPVLCLNDSTYRHTSSTVW